MKSYYLVLVVLIMIFCLQGCKTINSNTYAQSVDKILYTRGDNTRGVSNKQDNNNMIQLIQALDIRAESFPNINSSFPSKDQTKDEMKKWITEVVKSISSQGTLWWYLQGHGTKGSFTVAGSGAVQYQELFDHMLKEVQSRNKIINRLVIFILSCHSGSMIPIIEQYKNRLYRELIVLTPSSEDQVSYTQHVFPELISSANFLKIAHNNPDLEVNQILKELNKNVEPHNDAFSKNMGFNQECIKKISFSTYDHEIDSRTNQNTDHEKCSTIKTDVKISNRDNPTWRDLANLTSWLFENYGNFDARKKQDIQFKTIPENLENEPLFR